MAHINISVPAKTWTLLTTSDVTYVRVQNVGLFGLSLQATTGETAPTDLQGAVSLDAGLMISADVAVGDLFPGVSGAKRLWAYSGNATTVSVSHV